MTETPTKNKGSGLTFDSLKSSLQPGVDLLEDASEKVGDLLIDTAKMPLKGAGHVLWGLDKVNKFVNKNVMVGGDASYADARNSLISIAKNHGPQLGFGSEEGWELAAEIFTPDFIDFIGGVGYADNIAKGISKGGPEAGRLLKELAGKFDNFLNPKTSLALAGGGTVPYDKIDEVIAAGKFDIKASSGVTLNSMNLSSRAASVFGEAPNPKRAIKLDSASGPKYNQLKVEANTWLAENKEALLNGSIKRGQFGEIWIGGKRRRIQNLHEHLISGKPIKFVAVGGGEKRILDTLPPYQSLVDFADANRISQDVLARYLDDASSGFRFVREQARTEPLTIGLLKKEIESGKNTTIAIRKLFGIKPKHAGHATAAATGGPTSGFTAFKEDALANIIGKDNISHNMHNKVGELIGVAGTWEGDLMNYAARELGVKMPHPGDFTRGELELLLSIDARETDDFVMHVYGALMDARKNQSEFLKALGIHGITPGDEGLTITKKEALKYFQNADGSFPDWVERLIKMEEPGGLLSPLK